MRGGGAVAAPRMGVSERNEANGQRCYINFDTRKNVSTKASDKEYDTGKMFMSTVPYIRAANRI